MHGIASALEMPSYVLGGGEVPSSAKFGHYNLTWGIKARLTNGFQIA
jgi:hypothetical protein